jgi:hypothetical protein
VISGLDRAVLARRPSTTSIRFTEIWVNLRENALDGSTYRPARLAGRFAGRAHLHAAADRAVRARNLPRQLIEASNLT